MFIKRIPLLAANGTGAHGQLFNVYFPERYYEKLDTFQVIETKQQMIVLQAPIRKADNYWEYCVQLLDSTLEDEFDWQDGLETRFLTNIQPEFSEEGYTKYQSKKILLLIKVTL